MVSSHEAIRLPYVLVLGTHLPWLQTRQSRLGMSGHKLVATLGVTLPRSVIFKVNRWGGECPMINTFKTENVWNPTIFAPPDDSPIKACRCGYHVVPIAPPPSSSIGFDGSHHCARLGPTSLCCDCFQHSHTPRLSPSLSQHPIAWTPQQTSKFLQNVNE
jgi:hypothetical protein